MNDIRDDHDGCGVVMSNYPHGGRLVNDFELPYLILFAGVPEDEIEEVAEFWRWLYVEAVIRQRTTVEGYAAWFRLQFPPRSSSELWLADAARKWGLLVVEVNGWQSRSAGSFSPGGGVAHHTAGPTAGGDMPSLDVLINGRPDLNGPLANYGLGRSGTAYVIAAGRANHAGSGGWNGLSGNSSVIGIEAENDGYQEWPDAQLDAYIRLMAACCDAKQFSPDNWCRHHEWRSEKPDPHHLDGPAGRDAIAETLAEGPEPPEPLEEDDVSFLLITNTAGTQRLISSGGLDAVVNDQRSSQQLQAAGIKLAQLDDDTCSEIRGSLSDIRTGAQ